VEGQWRADREQRVLFGQSRGGSFALYAAYRRPRLFHAFIASNPGREADTRLLYGMNGTPPKGRTEGRLIVTSGSRDYDYLRGTALQWRRDVAGKPNLPWRAEFVDLEGATHAASVPQAYRAAMLKIFAKQGNGAGR
jgi:predicted alpha/beta superfamily hydrolase